MNEIVQLSNKTIVQQQTTMAKFVPNVALPELSLDKSSYENSELIFANVMGFHKSIEDAIVSHRKAVHDLMRSYYYSYLARLQIYNHLVEYPELAHHIFGTSGSPLSFDSVYP